MSPIFRILWALVDSALTDATDITRKLALIGKPEDETRISIYLRSIRRLALVVIFFPVPILIFGIVGDLEWIIALVGIFWGLVTLILLGLASPLGILLEILLRGPKGSGGRYVNLSLGILLAELTFTLFRAVVPIKNNPAAIPIVAVSAAILGILGAIGVKTLFTKRMVGTVATLIFVTFTLSFFFPESFNVLRGMREKMDKGIAATLRGENTSKLKREEEINYPTCEDARDIELLPTKGRKSARVKMYPNCWTGWIKTPATWGNYYFQSVENKGMEVMFFDGNRFWIEPNKKPWFPNRRGIFRFRGEGEVIASLEPIKSSLLKEKVSNNDTLWCGSNNFLHLTKTSSLTVFVPPTDCWTDWLVRPHDSMGSLTIAPYGELDIKVRFADGSTRLFLDFKPTTEIVVRDKKITGMRFRNNQNKPVRIEISLS